MNKTNSKMNSADGLNNKQTLSSTSAVVLNTEESEGKRGLKDEWSLQYV